MIKRVRSWLNQEDSQQTHQLSPDNIPHHVAIIMDGNGRWRNGAVCRESLAIRMA